MDIEAGEVLGTGRSHIIKRPRLTRLLDETEARIILLIAPAGYGKTTLAREWLADRPHGWYRGSPASSDVAALALGLAKAGSRIVPGAQDRLRVRLRVSRGPADELEELAELLSEDLSGWPQRAWLVFDDYQFACDSAPAERFVEQLVMSCELSLLVVTRTRPRWATARRALYGEIFEMGRSLLAMDRSEAALVLGEPSTLETEGIFSLADGWPALIGLATQSRSSQMPGETVAEELYGFFAEELYNAAEPDLQQALRHFALAPYVSPDIARTIGRDDAERHIARGLELGFFVQGREGLDLHPLLRTFLGSKFHKAADDPGGEVVARLVDVLIEREAWDEAFELASRFAEGSALIGLVEASLGEILDQARLPTLERWLASAYARRLDAPILHLAEAEIAFRQGDLGRAEALAFHAAQSFKSDSRFVSRSHWLAGTSAHVSVNEAIALAHFRAADRSAFSETDAMAAVWGQFIAAEALERAEEAAEPLEHYVSRSSGTVDELLRVGTGRLLMTAFFGDVEQAIFEQRHLPQLTDRARDPLIAAGFINVYAKLLVIAGQYETALEAAETQEILAKEHRFGFVLAFANLNVAAAKWGLRDFRGCRTNLMRCERLTTNSRARTEASLFLARTHLASGRSEEAIRALEKGHQVARSLDSLFAEHLAWRSLAHAIVGDKSRAEEFAEQALGLSRRTDVLGLVPWTRAILAADDDASPSAISAFDATLWTGNRDAFVTAYRASPRLLRAIRDSGEGHLLTTILERACDYDAAKKLGIPIAPSPGREGPDSLTNREREVLDLVSQGLTNKEIGRTLYITESTVKVHVRNICTKLGVRSRTEAATRAAEFDA